MVYRMPYIFAFSVFGLNLKPFEFWGAFGFLIAAILTIILSPILNLSLFYVLMLILLSVLTFYLSRFLNYHFIGKSDLVLYHQVLWIIVVQILFLEICGLSKSVYLDISLFGISIFLVFGRIGCFFSGCCHGKPAKSGVIYQINHLYSGFSRSYLGIRLFPVQLLESVLVSVGLLIIITYRLWSGVEGSFVQGILMWYFVLRFILEFFRGDTSRSYYFGISHSQWLSFIFAWAVLILYPPSEYWLKLFYQCGIAFLSVSVATLIFFYFITQKDLEKFYPLHLSELTEIVRHFQPNRIYVTSKNMGISFAMFNQEGQKKIILTLSNFTSKAFGAWISEILARFIYRQIDEKPHRLNTKPGVFQYINGNLDK